MVAWNTGRFKECEYIIVRTTKKVQIQKNKGEIFCYPFESINNRNCFGAFCLVVPEKKTLPNQKGCY